MTKTILLHETDNVEVRVERGEGVGAGHKIARTDIASGAAVVKFGQVIGYATQDISVGEHVHSHNIEFGGHGRTYDIGSNTQAARSAIPEVPERSFMGYRRASGRIGTRNMIALCATVNCSATVVRQAADEVRASGVLDDYPNVDDIVAFAHGTGCGMPQEGVGWDNLQRVLWGYATHPNVGATLFVGLGCEVMQIAKMKSKFGHEGSEGFHGLTIQDTGGTRATIERVVNEVKRLLPEVNKANRTPCPLSELTLALQCGGSDGYSGLTANPALGKAVDLLVGAGGTAILSETPEIFGAEQLLLQRAASPEVGQNLLDRIAWWENYTKINDASMDNNPSPGNKAGGLTTILEKSLGAVAKAGATPVNAVYEYAERVDEKGLVFMDTPGYDPVSATGQIAGGAQVLVFTTGRGSAFGSKPAPTIKLATNDRLYQSMTEDMDINCGDIITAGVTLDQKAIEILDAVIAVASGKPSKSEALGLGDNEFVPWQVGAVM